MEELVAIAGGSQVATNQVLYNVSRRGIEFDLMPWGKARRIPIMAYSPIHQAALLKNPTLARLAGRRKVTPAQIALAWVLRDPDVIAIPKSANIEHVRENRLALSVHLTDEDFAELDRAFPPPSRKVPLAVL
jgi:diketogulonate reductase-like aldo/keto reductase